MDLKTLASAANQIAEERGIEPKEVLAGIEEAIAAAYKKQYRERSEIVKSKFDLKTGALKFWLVKTVVDEITVKFDETEQTEGETTMSSAEEERPRYNSDRHIILEEAKKINPMLLSVKSWIFFWKSIKILAGLPLKPPNR